MYRPLPMPKRRHVARHGGTTKDAVEGTLSAHAAVPLFRVKDRSGDKDAGPTASPPRLVTLLFDAKSAQHNALSRIEAFYESPAQGEQRYVDVEAAKAQRQCPNYEAFNFPMHAVRAWLYQMRVAHGVDAHKPEEETQHQTTDVARDARGDDGPWWRAYCNREESQVLSYLEACGCLRDEEKAEHASTPTPVYLISTLSSQQASSLPHEQLHFLYHIAPSYRSIVQRHYDSLQAKTQRIIENDLRMRGYAQHVWLDEFQAYVSLDAGEFGKKAVEECGPIRLALIQVQKTLLKEWKDGGHALVE